MRGDSESASKNTSKPIFKYPKYSNIRIFENSLASDLVFVIFFTNMNMIMNMAKNKNEDKINMRCLRASSKSKSKLLNFEPHRPLRNIRSEIKLKSLALFVKLKFAVSVHSMRYAVCKLYLNI